MFAAEMPPHGPLNYSLIWLLLGIACLILVLGWLGFVFWSTRKREPKKARQLSVLPPVNRLAALQQKYLGLIDGHYRAYQDQQMSLRELHKQLSMTVRLFVYEASQVPAHKLSLRDLQQLPYPLLVRLMTAFYANEFPEIERGSGDASVAAAKDVVQRWR